MRFATVSYGVGGVLWPWEQWLQRCGPQPVLVIPRNNPGSVIIISPAAGRVCVGWWWRGVPGCQYASDRGPHLQPLDDPPDELLSLAMELGL